MRACRRGWRSPCRLLLGSCPVGSAKGPTEHEQYLCPSPTSRECSAWAAAGLLAWAQMHWRHWRRRGSLRWRRLAWLRLCSSCASSHPACRGDCRAEEYCACREGQREVGRSTISSSGHGHGAWRSRGPEVESSWSRNRRLVVVAKHDGAASRAELCAGRRRPWCQFDRIVRVCS